MDFRYLLLGTVAILATATATSAVAQTRAYYIPAGDAAASLQAFARQSGKQVLFPFDAVQGRRAPAIIGRFDDADVLARLAEAAGLEVVTSDARTVTLRRATNIRSARPEAAGEESVTQLDEIVVVGSHIRGVGNGASPVIQFDNRMIAQSGAATLQQFFDKLPQNFGGGANAGNNANSGVDRDVGSNWGAGSGLNLRGLGTGTTLTLLNGRRLTTSNQFQYVDISLIPVSAVERIEVLTDGASAL
ncbi:TonB-dependent receptor plug domain-containing protein [Brevundimonas naejangsanensis]